ncbi:MAG: hypothetical protein M2R45_04147 [Verrucomicrobia subdivision 3 bacterium]|nr:hypothetical protein [Limisphaerales bacterium]MCS1417714.1 hypothetical protein [Limisphaerales bacterium]
MSAITDILEMIRDTDSVIRRLEAEIKTPQDAEDLALNLASLQKRRNYLKRDLEQATARQQVDICRFRLFSDNNSAEFPASGLTAALGGFQSLLTSVLDAIKNGPKQRLRPDASIVAESRLNFGYTFAGSLGIVLTISNERLLLGFKSHLDRAVDSVFEMAESRDSEHIAGFSKQLGGASVRCLSKWVDSLSEWELGTDIEWCRDRESRRRLVLQTPDVAALKQAIAKTSDKEEKTLECEGTLVGCDVDTKKFHMQIPDSDDLLGDISETIGKEHTLELPKKYRAKFRRTITTHFATEAEQIRYLLLSLDPL